MDKTLWRLNRIGERLWILSTMTATQAAILANEGRGIAVVASETRRLGNHVNDAVEKVMVGGEELNKDAIMALSFELNLLALNTAIESNRIVGHRGKQAAIYAEEIRNLAFEIVCLFDEASAAKKKQTVSPWAANPSSVAKNGEFILLNVGGMNFVESLTNIKEICMSSGYRDGNVIVRDMEIPYVDVYKMLSEKQKPLTHVVVWTPWAGQNKAYAVTAEVSCLFSSPVGKTMDVPSDMPLAKYVRECWENENGEPFYFMDWTKMV